MSGFLENPAQISPFRLIAKALFLSSASQRQWLTTVNAKDLIEVLRELPKGGKIALRRKEFEEVFRDPDRQQRAEKIARLNNCTLAVDENSGVATFTRVA